VESKLEPRVLLTKIVGEEVDASFGTAGATVCGDEVGRLVGLSVLSGDIVGLIVGDSVGCVVGLTEGLSVGVKVGD
jgi:hypothetical protein